MIYIFGLYYSFYQSISSQYITFRRQSNLCLSMEILRSIHNKIWRYYMALYFDIPVQRMAARQQMLERIFGNSIPTVAREVMIPVDVIAEKEEYIITALLPGLTADEVDIRIANDTVTIEGEIKNDRDEKANYVVQERPSGRFTRNLTLPDPLDATKAEADLKNGVLTLRIPKAEEARPKTIKVINK
jgi:HSP20 family protein